MNTNKKSARILNNYVINIHFMILYFFLFNSFLLSQASMVTEGIKGNLVSVEWLVKNLNNKEVLILDAAQPQQYTAQHIPGAVSVDFMTYGIKELSPAELEQKFQALGISADKKIVIYDRGAPMMATRVFFDLLYSGFPVKNLFVLNGGLTKWLELNNPVTSEVVPVSKKGNFKINKFNEKIRAKLPEFLTASGEKENNILVEALDANWHFGELQVFDRPGHIPNGILIPASDFFNADKTFKSPEEIKKIFSYHGISKEKQIYTYCGGGIAATVPFFSLKFILDYPDVKLFRESEMGWLQDERELPFWTYDAPYLMRATDWIKTWGGKMMRMYGISKVSLIDVRSAESFAQGHIPFMLNIPSELFNKNIGDPQKLTELLIKSGVNPSHEAVVVSGEGLNEQSALAFLLLEYLGWKKVSVFIDSNEKFVQSGIALEKEEKADNKNGKENQLQSLQAEPIKVRKEIMITDPNSTTGVYPKVFISSGKDGSNKNPEGKVVHLPYHNFLNADGTPKAAKEIWKILQKAGVPRYAELVCFSDNPGEAAVNYFILKLMGYPDIKVLVI